MTAARHGPYRRTERSRHGPELQRHVSTSARLASPVPARPRNEGESMRMMSLLISLALISMAGCQSDKKAGVSTKTIEDRNREVMENKQDMDDQRGDVRETHVTSRDGTTIALKKPAKDRSHFVNGALAHRNLYGDQPLAAKLSEHFTVYIYDRRGRGESTDVQPYAVERESKISKRSSMMPAVPHLFMAFRPEPLWHCKRQQRWARRK